MNKKEIEEAKEHYIFTTKHILDDSNKRLKEYIKYLEQKESILDKVKKKLKEDIKKFDKLRKRHKMYSASEERLSSKYFYAQEILNIIEGEKDDKR